MLASLNLVLLSGKVYSVHKVAQFQWHKWGYTTSTHGISHYTTLLCKLLIPLLLVVQPICMGHYHRVGRLYK